MRFLHDLPRRYARLLMPRRGGPGARPRHHDSRRARRRRVAPRTAGVPRRRRRPVGLLYAGADRRRTRPDRPRPGPRRPRHPRGPGGQPVPVHRLREDPGRGASRSRAERHAMNTLVIENAHIATVDAADTEYPIGHVVVDDNRISAVGAGQAPVRAGARTIDARGCLVTPGLVNTHHHLYQWLTRGHAVDDPLFRWLTELYPVWAGIDEHAVHVAASAGLTWLARTGCTTSTDHHYVFPREGGDVFAAEVEAARRVGLRFHPTRGSM